jgi:hypothetical protein
MHSNSLELFTLVNYRANQHHPHLLVYSEVHWGTVDMRRCMRWIGAAQKDQHHGKMGLVWSQRQQSKIADIFQ